MTAFEAATLEAPGKLFLAGEYAVLEPGRAALVVAVDRTLRLSLRPDAEAIVELWHKPSLAALVGELTGDAANPVRWIGGIPSELRFAARATELGLRLCAEEKLAKRGYRATFENDFSGGFDAAEMVGTPIIGTPTTSPKLGLGGSAAAAVLALRAACLSQGRAISAREVFALAAAAHWVEQGGRGSGGDVAASSLGGALEIEVRRAPEDPNQIWRASATQLLAEPPVAAAPIALPEDLRLLAVWSGKSADTREMMREIRALAAAKPGVYQARLDRIGFVAKMLRAALGAAARDPGPAPRAEVLAQVRHGATAMAQLGEDALTFVVTPELSRICAVAASMKCAAKPSGAGGGDCAVVFAFGDEARARVQASLRALGFPSAAIAVAPSVK